MTTHLSPAEVVDRLRDSSDPDGVEDWVGELAQFEVPVQLPERDPAAVVAAMLDPTHTGEVPDGADPALDEAEARALLRPTGSLGPLLRRLGLPERDVHEVEAGLNDFSRYPELRWLLARLRVWLAAQRQLLGAGGAARPETHAEAPDRRMLRSLPDHYGAIGRYFYLLLVVSSAPALLRFNRRHSVPDEVSLTTLADVRRGVDLHRRVQRTGGLDNPAWLLWHLCGALFTLGRLQFQPRKSQLDPVSPDGPRLHEPVLNIHIPDESGPLSPAACRDSVACAAQFYAQLFPDPHYRYAICRSWLLDEQLTDYLRPESNILQFQRMFTRVESEPTGPVEADTPGPDGLTPRDRSVLSFVYRRHAHVSAIDLLHDEINLEFLPRQTTLERAVLGHLETGGHWTVGSGWLRLSEFRR